MISVTNKTCTGCRACEQRCPTKCITMQTDNEGFSVASVDSQLCVNCGLCDKVCPQTKDNTALECSKAVAFHLNDKVVNSYSTSGGAFAGLAQLILEKNGIVFGAAFVDVNHVNHIEISSKDELRRLQGSKYVQSNTVDTYTRTRDYLTQGRIVLYSGTACQIAGLKAFLGKEYENLLCVDVICHGVSSPLLFEKYILWLQRQKKRKVVSYHFRTKSKAGWGNYGKVIYDEQREQYFSSNDPYIKSFMTGLNYRECCYDCNYANLKRISDLTLGDFWGIQRSYPELYQKDGVSAVLINTAKGQYWLNKLAKKAHTEAVDINEIVPYQTNLQHPTHRPEERTNFYNGIASLNINEYMNQKLLTIVTKKDRLHAMVPMSLKYAIKRFRKGF